MQLVLQNVHSSVAHSRKTNTVKVNESIKMIGRPIAAGFSTESLRSVGSSPTTQRRTSVVTCVGKTYVGGLSGTGMKMGVIVGRFNDLVTKLLLQGALDTFERHGVASEDVDVAWVPGSYELPLVAKAMAKSGKYDAILAIGAVVRGSTTHYDEVCSAANGGLLNANLDTGVPVVFGVLTCDTMEQALDRAGGKVGNKGGECAVTAVEMANLMKQLTKDGKAVSASNW